MKQIKIRQRFLDYIKSGIKDFEIRKEPNLEGEVELTVVEHNCGRTRFDSITTGDVCGLSEGTRKKVYADICIKDRLKVKLTKTAKSTYEIVRDLYEEKFGIRNIIINLQEQIANNGFDLEKRKSILETFIKKENLLSSTTNFLVDYTGDNKPLYGYDLEVIE